MSAAIEQLTPEQEIEQMIDDYISAAKQVALRNLAYAGNEGVNAAREGHTYKDQTGNLTSSVGCMVVDGGKVVGSNGFETILSADRGSQQGRTFAEQMAARYSDIPTLVVVAGMEYAAHVSNKGYDVLDSAYLKAKETLTELIEK